MAARDRHAGDASVGEHHHPLMAEERRSTENYVYRQIMKRALAMGRPASVVDIGGGSGGVLRAMARGFTAEDGISHIHVLAPIVQAQDEIRWTSIPVDAAVAAASDGPFDLGCGITVCKHKLADCDCVDHARVDAYVSTHSAYYLGPDDLIVIPLGVPVFMVVHQFTLEQSGMIHTEFMWTRHAGRILMSPCGSCGTGYDHPDITAQLSARMWDVYSGDVGKRLLLSEERVAGATSVFRGVMTSDMSLTPVVVPPVQMPEKYVAPLATALMRVPLKTPARDVYTTTLAAASAVAKTHSAPGLRVLEQAVSLLPRIRSAQARLHQGCEQDQIWQEEMFDPPPPLEVPKSRLAAFAWWVLSVVVGVIGVALAISFGVAVPVVSVGGAIYAGSKWVARRRAVQPACL